MTTKMRMQELLGVSSAMVAAMRAGLLSAVAEGPASAAAIAARCKTDARATRLVLDVLAAAGVVERANANDEYRAGAMMIDAQEAAPLGIDGLARIWGHADELLRSGTPIAAMSEAREREATYRNVVDALARMSEGWAATLAAAIDRPPSRVLDIGCGSGVWGLAVAQRFPEAHVTGLDLPDVVRRFEARADALGLAGRAHAIGADIHAASTIEPGSFDLVVVANILRIEDEQRARAIVARAAHATSRQAIVVDALAEGTPERDRARAVYTLHLAMRSRDGNVHSRESIDAWFAEHGLRRVAVVDFDESSPAAALIFERR